MAAARACDTGTVVMNDLAGRLAGAADAIGDLAPDVIAGEPWPLAGSVGPGPESSWGPREVLAHLAEMLPFWLGEIELIIDAGVLRSEGVLVGPPGPGLAEIEPPEFGRLEADPLRVGAIDRDRRFPSRELLSRVEVEGRRVATRLRALDMREAAMLGRHPTRGELTVAAVVDLLIVRHIEGHVTQLRESVALDR